MHLAVFANLMAAGLSLVLIYASDDESDNESDINEETILAEGCLMLQEQTQPWYTQVVSALSIKYKC